MENSNMKLFFHNQAVLFLICFEKWKNLYFLRYSEIISKLMKKTNLKTELNLDYLIIGTPPSTSDIHIAIYNGHLCSIWYHNCNYTPDLPSIKNKY